MRKLPLPLLLLLFGFFVLLPGLAAVAAGNENEVLPLPRWSDQELEKMREHQYSWAGPGHLLWPEDMLDVTMPPSSGQMLADGSEADSPEAEQPHADVSRFLPPSLVTGSQSPLPPEVLRSHTAESLQEVSDLFLKRASDSAADEHLIDPDYQIPDATRDALVHFLESHARDARIKLYLLVLGRDQKLPAKANLAAIAQGSLLQNDACLAVCPYGEPWRLRLFMSQSVHDKVPAAQLSEMIDDGVRDAMHSNEPEEQFHRLLVRLSIRLFWLEPAISVPVPVAETVAKAIVPILVAPAQSLPEIVPAPVEKESPSLLHTPSSTALLMALIGLLISFAAWRWRAYRLRHYEWILPEATTLVPRFGAPHGASAVWVQYRQG